MNHRLFYGALEDNPALIAISGTIGSLSSAQLGGAVSGEAAATIATDNVMMASGRKFAGSDADPASPPANGGGSSPAVSLGATAAVTYENGTEVGADVNVDTQLQQWGYNVYAGADADGVKTESALISLAVSTDEPDGSGGRRRHRLKVTSRRRLNGEDDEEGDEAPLMFVMQNIKPIDYSVGAEEVYVNLTCPLYFIGRVEAVCPQTNFTVATNCSGRYWNEVTGQFDYELTTALACNKVASARVLWSAVARASRAFFARRERV